MMKKLSEQMPNINMHQKKFTLVELMVAMAILVIMMGFLFQFVNGARRIWMASTATAEAFDDAQIVLQTMENDLKKIVQYGDDYGHRKLALSNFTSGSYSYLIFPIGQANDGGVVNDSLPALIIYAYTGNNLYRQQVLAHNATPPVPSKNWFNLSPTDLVNLFDHSTSALNNSLVCDDLHSLNISTLPNSLCPGQTAAIKLTLSLTVEDLNAPGNATSTNREFSKFVFLL